MEKHIIISRDKHEKKIIPLSVTENEIRQREANNYYLTPTVYLHSLPYSTCLCLPRLYTDILPVLNRSLYIVVLLSVSLQSRKPTIFSGLATYSSTELNTFPRQ